MLFCPLPPTVCKTFADQSHFLICQHQCAVTASPSGTAAGSEQTKQVSEKFIWSPTSQHTSLMASNEKQSQSTEIPLLNHANVPVYIIFVQLLTGQSSELFWKHKEDLLNIENLKADMLSNENILLHFIIIFPFWTDAIMYWTVKDKFRITL